MKHLILPILVSFSCFAYAQEMEECGFLPDQLVPSQLPYYANNELLENISNIVERQNKKQRFLDPNHIENTTYYSIPVQVTAYYETGKESSFISEEEIMTLLDGINDIYRGYGIEFYLENSIVREANDAYSEITTTAELFDLLGEFDPDGVVQWIIVDHLEHDGGSVGGIGRAPYQTHPYKLVLEDKPLIYRPQLVATMIHELGHVFGLLHTHQGWDQHADVHGKIKVNLDNVACASCFQEPVDNTRLTQPSCLYYPQVLQCSVTGDLICDTKASPASLKQHYKNCDYRDTYVPWSKTDVWGDTWDPPMENYMSYSPRECKTTLTPSQIAVMHGYINEAMDNDLLRVNHDHIALEGFQLLGQVSEYSAARYITAPASSSGVVECYPQSQTSFIAGEQIVLNPGFVAHEQSNFTAEIGLVSSSSTASMPLQKQPIKRQEWMNEVSRLWSEAQEQNITSTEDFKLSEVAHKVFPNPAKQKIQLEFYLPDRAEVSLIIQDQLGRTIKHQVPSHLYSLGRHRMEINLEDYRSGIYIYLMKVNGTSYSGKFVKQ